MKYRIPFNRPHMVGKELYYIAQCVLAGHTAGDGPFTKRCEQLLSERLGGEKVLLTTSCTSALEIAALLTGAGPGTEVILPSFTFVSTANAFALTGAKLIFADILPDSLNMDVAHVENLMTDRTRVIVPVHYAGVACEMAPMLELAERADALVVEDAAQALNATYRGSYLGTVGDIGCFSFHETKNYICGEGGAIVCNRSDLVERAEIIRQKGTNRNQFLRGEVDKYTWVDLGSSYAPSDILAAFLYAQLENIDAITDSRRQLHERYRGGLQALAARGLVELPLRSVEGESSYHMFHILVEDQETRTRLIDHLKSKGILATFHFVPLHSSPVGRRMGYREGQLPVTERQSARLLRLPFFNGMEEDELSDVLTEIYRFYGVPPATSAADSVPPPKPADLRP